MLSHSLLPSLDKYLILFPLTHRCFIQTVRSAHGFFGMEIDESSRVFNGDTRGKHPDRTSLHMISGGSVKNNSTLFNGDLDPESFNKIFAKER